MVSGDGNETTSITTTAGGGRKRSKVTSSSSGSKVRKGSSSESMMAGGETASIGGRDSALFLFRALGKILYCKRKSLSMRTYQISMLPCIIFISLVPTPLPVFNITLHVTLKIGSGLGDKATYL